jgi:hypothetical protein
MQVVDGISNYQGDILWQGLRGRDVKLALSRIRIFLNDESAVVGPQEGKDKFLKITDVFFGPFNF